MKKLVTIVSIVLCLLACSDNESNFERQFLGQWQLIQMQGSIMESAPLTGTEMDWQERYTFQSNGTVIKERERDDITTSISGTFERFIGNGMFPALKINYDEDSEIIGSCYDLEEYVYLKTAEQMRGEWEQCDGPILLYARNN